MFNVWQLTVDHWTTDRGARTVDHGPWSKDRGPWTLDNGPLTVERGPWTMDRGARTMVPALLTMDHWPWRAKLHRIISSLSSTKWNIMGKLHRRILLLTFAKGNLLMKPHRREMYWEVPRKIIVLLSSSERNLIVKLHRRKSYCEASQRNRSCTGSVNAGDLRVEQQIAAAVRADRGGHAMTDMKHLKCFFVLLANRRTAKGLDSLEDLDGYSVLLLRDKLIRIRPS